MLIALLALLGVNLIVVAVLLVSVLTRKRWVKRQSGAFRGVIRVAGGEVDGLRSTWGRGYGRWVGDVLVWTKAPLLLRNEIVVADGSDPQRPATPGEVKRLGEHPIVMRVRAGSATVDVAAADDARELLRGSFDARADAAVPAESSPAGQA
jgi:hypothetical protein